MNAPDEGPVVMLNLLKFKEADGGSGAAEYGKYGDSVVQMVEARGGKVLWMGKVDQTLIGDLDAKTGTRSRSCSTRAARPSSR